LYKLCAETPNRSDTSATEYPRSTIWRTASSLNSLGSDHSPEVSSIPGEVQSAHPGGSIFSANPGSVFRANQQTAVPRLHPNQAVRPREDGTWATQQSSGAVALVLRFLSWEAQSECRMS
jgi:hypothetical protein